jgi:hypothetical protein
VIVAVPLRSVRYTAVTPWLSQAFGGAGLQADQEPSANMLLLSGPPTVVAEALRAVGILDRPKARAARTMRAALVASCLRGALPPVDLRAVCFVRA